MKNRKEKLRISYNAERESGKAFINLFYLTILATFVTSTLTSGQILDTSVILQFGSLALACLFLGIWLITHADNRERSEEDFKRQTTEVKKGIFHIQNAEIQK